MKQMEQMDKYLVIDFTTKILQPYENLILLDIKLDVRLAPWERGPNKSRFVQFIMLFGNYIEIHNYNYIR